MRRRSKYQLSPALSDHVQLRSHQEEPWPIGRNSFPGRMR
jgi:hypothetical protein